MSRKSESDIIINILFKSKLNDIMSGYRVFNKKLVKSIPILSEGFELETELTLSCLDKRYIIKEIPINYKDRPKGSVSKLNTFKDGFKVLKTIFKIYKKLERNIPYMVGVDCSTGTNGDNNSITILNPFTLEPDAEFECSYIGETLFEQLLKELVKVIPRCVLIIERNSVGDGIIDHLLHSEISSRLYSFSHLL